MVKQKSKKKPSKKTLKPKTKRSPQVTKVVAKRKSKKTRKTKAVKTIVPPVIPDLALPPIYLPVESAAELEAEELAEKIVREPVSKVKLWTAVILTMCVIISLWGLSLRYTVFKGQGSFAQSIRESNVDSFFSNLQQDWQQLQNSAATFPAPDTTLLQTNTTPTTNSNTNNLFSDLR